VAVPVGVVAVPVGVVAGCAGLVAAYRAALLVALGAQTCG